MRVVWLMIAVSLFLLGLLTVVQSPEWSPWKLAVLAGEFGHWFAVVAGGVAAVAIRWRRLWKQTESAARRPEGDVGKRERVLRRVTVGVAVAAMGLLLVPTWQAAQVGGELPARLRAEFGEGTVARPAFSVGGYFGGETKEVPVETLAVREGLPLDFFRAVRMDGRAAPCVVMVHGGGWDSGDRTQLPELNHRLARLGYAVAAVSYRLAPEHRWPAQRLDVESAIVFLKANASRLGIDASRLVLFGRSAGGQIAQVTGYVARDRSIRGVIALYAPSDLYFGYVNTHEHDMLRSPALMRQLLGGPPEQVRAQYEAASAINFVTPQAPPTLLLHGRKDALAWHRHSERLEARLEENGVPQVYVRLPWATHAFDFNLRGPGGQLTTFAVEWFLAAVTR